jgi:hypothetical protein
LILGAIQLAALLAGCLLQVRAFGLQCCSASSRRQFLGN